MVKQDYYALINYRNTKKYYYVSASEENDPDGYDLRIEYVDYNPEREWSGVWIKNSKQKIVRVFDQTTEEYKYLKSIHEKWNRLINELPWDRRGTSVFLRLFKKVIKETPNPLNIEIYKKPNTQLNK